jgi:hypothetical protein
MQRSPYEFGYHAGTAEGYATAKLCDSCGSCAEEYRLIGNHQDRLPPVVAEAREAAARHQD